MVQSTNEIQARKILMMSLRMSVCIADLKVTLPKLTDDECKNIALNYPYSYMLLRQSFPRV